jgi:hypothetical protein
MATCSCSKRTPSCPRPNAATVTWLESVGLDRSAGRRGIAIVPPGRLTAGPVRSRRRAHLQADLPAHRGMTANFAKHRETPTMQVGFIGLGTMGASMATNLQKAGYKLVVHDLQRQNAGVHSAAGAQWAARPRPWPRRARSCFLSLPGPPEVEAVALGKDGLIEGLKKGSACFDLTTNSPTLVRRIEKIYASAASTCSMRR